MNTEKYITKDYVVAAADSYESIPFQNAVFTQARLVVSLGFSPDALAGMALELWAYGSNMGRIMSLTPIDHTSITKISKPFDIAGLNGFNIIFRNKDLNQSVEIVNSKLVMWND